MQNLFRVLAVMLTAASWNALAQQDPPLRSKVDDLTKQLEPKLISWRRDIHEHPELSNREFRTGKLVAEHLKQLGLAVRAPIAHTGVVAVLKGARPGPVVALRADMDALPVTEQTNHTLE